MRERIL